jgi:hypothetical protein
VVVRSEMVPVSVRCAQELRALLAAAHWGAANPDTVDAVAERVSDGDAWVREWTASGGAAWAWANDRGSASGYLHAASYYAAALALIDESDGWIDEDRLWARQRECWDRAVRLLGGERVSIAYEQTTLPGYFFSAGHGRRPLVVVLSRGRPGHLRRGGRRRRRGPRPRLALDDVRRSGSPGGPAPSGPGAAA